MTVRRLPIVALVLSLTAWSLLFAAVKDVRLETMHGTYSLMNSIRLWKPAGSEAFPLTPGRAPVGPVLLSPLTAAAYASGGPERALRAARLAATGLYGALVGLSFIMFAGLFSPPVALALAVSLAFDHVLLQSAVFFNFDVLGTIMLLLFLRQAWRWQERPSMPALAASGALYAAALLTRYHLAVLFLVPPLWDAARGRFKDALRNPHLLLPAAGLLACLAALILLSSVPEHALNTILFEIRQNVLRKRDYPAWTYLLSFWRQLGPLLSAAALGGMVLCWRGSPKERFLACALAAVVALLSLAIQTRAARFGICVLPLLYVMAGKGLERALAAAPRRGALVLALFMLAQPWDKRAWTLDVLAREPILRSRGVLDLGRWLEEKCPPGGRVAWLGDVVHVLPLRFNYEDRFTVPVTLGAMPLHFYARRAFTDHPAALGDAVIFPRSLDGPVLLEAEAGGETARLRPEGLEVRPLRGERSGPGGRARR